MSQNTDELACAPQDFVKQVAQRWPARNWRDHTIVVGVSGGADSVALLRAMHTLREEQTGTGQLVVGHVNHGIRGQHSDDDEQWVIKLARALGLDVSIRRLNFQKAESNRGQGLESALRAARYDALRDISYEHGARHVLLGHSLNDQVETVVFRFMRGTGLEGLAGMPQIRELAVGISLVRPLLNLDRNAIENFLQWLDQPFLEDVSNYSDQYTRNRIRNQLLPQLRRDFNPKLNVAVLQLAQMASEAQEVVEQLAAALVEQSVDFRANQVIVLDLDRLNPALPYVLRAVFRLIWRRMNWPQQDMSFEKWNQLEQLATVQRRRSIINLPGPVRAERIDQEIRLELRANS